MSASRSPRVKALRWIAGGGTTPPRWMKARNLLERLRQAKMESRARSGDPVRRHDDRAEPTRDFDHLAHDRGALDLIGVEDCLRRKATQYGGQLPGQVRGILHAAVHPLPGERRHQMRRIAGEEHPAAPPMFGDARMERIDGLALDLERNGAAHLRDEGADRLVAFQRLLAFAGQLHELPADALADRRQLDSRSARIATEGDLPDVVILDDRVDHQPALRIGRADELEAKALPRRAGAAVASDDVVRLDRRRAGWRRDGERHTLGVLDEVGRLMFEGDPD